MSEVTGRVIETVPEYLMRRLVPSWKFGLVHVTRI